MNVLFLEPAFPASQREFVRALASIGANVFGIGERPYDWLDDETRGRLSGYQQIASVTDEGALEWAVRDAQSRFWVDRLEAVIEAHVLPAAHVRERCTIPGVSARTAYLCRDKVAMKDVLRRAGVPTAASAGVTSVAEAEDFVRAHGFPVILKPRDAAGAAGAFRAGNPAEFAAAARARGLADGAPVAIEEFVEGHE
nr:ATPase [Paracoccaceae bacterium]